MGYFVFNEPAMQQTFHEWSGLFGRYLAAKSEELAALGRITAGFDTGRLKGSIEVDYGTTTTGGDLQSKVGVLGAAPITGYAYYHHEGTLPHQIYPNTAKALKFNFGGVTVFAAHVNHPGTRANKYLTSHLRALF